MRKSFSISTGVCMIATHELSPNNWGHQKTGRAQPSKTRKCACDKTLPPEQSCGGAEFMPNSRNQKYQPECSKRVHEFNNGPGSWNKETRRRASKQSAHKRTNPEPQERRVQAAARLAGRVKQALCQLCYNLPHAECRGTVLAVSVARPRTPTKFGCPECEHGLYNETIDRPEALVSNAALVLGDA